MSMVLGLLMLQGWAEAASRLALTMEQSGSLIIDGAPHPPALPGQRVIINHISPGEHALEIHDQTGAVLYQGVILVPDSGEVTARWSLTGGLTLDGAVVPAQPLPAHTVPGSGGPYADLGSGSVTVSGGIGHASSSSSDGENMAAAGGTDGVTTTNTLAQATGQIAQNIAYNAVPGGNIARSVSGSGIGGAALNAVRSSPAGTSLGSSPPKKRIVKPDPKAILGEVILFNRDAVPMDIYVDGMYTGTIGAGELDRTFHFEIGQRQVEFWVGSTAKFRGELQVDQNVPVQLEVSQTANPRSLNRSWAWADRY